MIARSERSIVEPRAVVTNVVVGGDLPRVVRRAQQPSRSLIHPDRLRARELDDAVDGFRERDRHDRGGDVFLRDRLDQREVRRTVFPSVLPSAIRPRNSKN